MTEALAFNIFVEISTQACEFFSFKELIILPISLVDVLLNFILAKGLLDISDK